MSIKSMTWGLPYSTSECNFCCHPTHPPHFSEPGNAPGYLKHTSDIKLTIEWYALILCTFVVWKELLVKPKMEQTGLSVAIPFSAEFKASDIHLSTQLYDTKIRQRALRRRHSTSRKRFSGTQAHLWLLLRNQRKKNATYPNTIHISPI